MDSKYDATSTLSVFNELLSLEELADTLYKKRSKLNIGFFDGDPASRSAMKFIHPKEYQEFCSWYSEMEEMLKNKEETMLKYIKLPSIDRDYAIKFTRQYTAEHWMFSTVPKP